VAEFNRMPSGSTLAYFKALESITESDLISVTPACLRFSPFCYFAFNAANSCGVVGVMSPLDKASPARPGFNALTIS
jgi:hypothetical protein